MRKRKEQAVASCLQKSHLLVSWECPSPAWLGEVFVCAPEQEKPARGSGWSCCGLVLALPKG